MKQAFFIGGWDIYFNLARIECASQSRLTLESGWSLMISLNGFFIQHKKTRPSQGGFSTNEKHSHKIVCTAKDGDSKVMISK